ncbi:MAG: aminopeptidase P N-terminal domain-containing protein [Candidatus Marinimicrobia bacterium]|nr:aminopeptidase P N-terminal domain-containing protein [Candidatus Neomarinimicrobiota bacterium]
MSCRFILSLILLISSLWSIDAQSFRERRETVQHQLGPRSAMILTTAEEYNRNGDVDHPFRPNSDYWYLSGHHEPMGRLILLGPDFLSEDEIQFKDEIIFTRRRNAYAEVWTGKRLGITGVKEQLGFSYAEVSDSFRVVLDKVLPLVDTVYVNLSNYMYHGPSKLEPEFLNDEELSKLHISHAGEIIHPLRHLKSREEIDLIQRAVDITGEGLMSAMKRTRPKLNEYNIQAAIEFTFFDLGSRRLGFPSIIGSGSNTTILHYIDNNRTMEDGDLLLMDVGAEYEMYTADVTRTIPVNGKFTPAQRELYTYVLEAQTVAFDSIRSGMTLRKDLHNIAKNYLEEKGFGRYFIHGLGHWLGLDVHDVGGRQAKIEPGTVFTIEPGIYIAENDTTAPLKYRGIGIRIEDDVLMTEDGPVWLSADIPREVDDIERMMKRRWRIKKGR